MGKKAFFGNILRLVDLFFNTLKGDPITQAVPGGSIFDWVDLFDTLWVGPKIPNSAWWI